MHSSITIKKKTCVGCGRLKYIFSKGRCEYCTKLHAVKSGSAIIKKTKRKSKTEGLDEWFEDFREEMTGFCWNCGRPSAKYTDDYRCSAAHILPKNLFRSVELHPLNRLELCFWGEGSCHTNYDNKTLDLTQMNCYDTIIERFLKIYPSIAPHERKNIPQVLLNYLDIEKDRNVD